MPNLPVDVDSWGRSACYPRGSFYPLSDGNSTQYRRITKPYFRTCSTCRSRSQAPFCLYTLGMVSIHSEGTFGRLRYSFGGDRPSQTARLTLSIRRLHGAMVRIPATEEWYPNGRSTKTGVLASKPPTYPVHPLPKSNVRLQSSSTGSFRPVAGNGHLHPYFNFTGPPVETALTSRYAIRAGRNLPDKEFRYLRTVIVTAAVYWGFGSLLRLALTLPLNLPAPGRRQHLYVSSRFRRYLCFC